MFRRLSTELTVIYAALFGAALLLIAGAVYFAVENNANRAVRADMNASSAVFDQLWDLRAKHLGDTADVLARDFGFREAVATAEDATIVSALENIQARFALDAAFVVGLEGEVVSIGDAAPVEASDALLDSLYENPGSTGVLMIGGGAYQAVAAPINAPTLLGWVVFGQELGRESLAELEGLSATPLTAHLYIRDDAGAWSEVDTETTSAIGVDAAELSGRAFRDSDRMFVRIPENNSIAGVKQLAPFSGDLNAALLLEYSLDANQAQYRAMLLTIMGIGAVGLVALILGSWFVSRGVTGPVSALHAAASKLAKGDLAEVRVEGRNEIAELAANFNVMSGEIIARERRIVHLVHHDDETGLPNIRALEDELADIRGAATRENIFGASIGLDRFQNIRGAIGHAMSARLIAEVGARLTSEFPELAVGRVATDRIGVVFRATSREEAAQAASRIVQVVSQPLRLGADRIDVHATVGLACDADDTDIALALLERAEVAVEQARAQRVSVAMFDRRAYGDPASGLSLMSSMIAGLDRGELFLAHQPKFDLHAGRLSNVESLIRWRHPERGMIRPDAFIGMAEETGHIRPLTDWVIDRAIHDQRRMRAAGHDAVFSVNVSGRLIASEDFAEHALKQVARSNAKLCFEITETAVIDNPDLALNVMKAFNEAGIGVSIDDYGSGLSSLSYLRMIPAQELKIDQAFIRGLSPGSSDSVLVRSTIDLAHSLGMKVTAEGVETVEVLSQLHAMGADTAQGYYIAKPLPIEDLLTFWNQPQAWPQRGIRH